MMSFIKTAAFAALTLLASSTNADSDDHSHDHSHGGYESGLPCTPCDDFEGDCLVTVKVNFFASTTGYYEIDSCEGVNPTLLLTVGRTYLFDQTDISNWYHMIGFAYEADGAFAGVPELTPGNAPGDSNCTETLSCPAPMYFMGGEYTGVYSNVAEIVPIPEEPSEDYGLETVYPLFFHPLGDWQEAGPFVTALNFDVEYDEDIFYFSNSGVGMSARIKLMDSDGNLLSASDTPALPYEYDEIDEFDYKCGTTNLTDFSNPEEGECPEMTVCEDGIALSEFADCTSAMNCHMMSSMTTKAVSRTALFSHQMIPHHQNAINMAKSLLKQHEFVCEIGGIVEEGAVIPWECELIPILYDIINVQNAQIVDLRKVLSDKEYNEYENCDVDFTKAASAQVSRFLAEPDFMKEDTGRGLEETAEESEECAYEHGIECTPCEGTDGICRVMVSVDLYAGEWGYYTFEGCEGVNPTLNLEIGRTYIFDQRDVSNHYHLIGFSYEADGAHVGVDELEPGIAPGNSDCDEDMTCPAPMYYLDNRYKGKYSNNKKMGVPPTTDKEDFGLDVVEPLFFHPLADWEGYGVFATALMFDDENFTEDIFYFCHVHAGMTGRIKLTKNGVKVSEENKPAIPYEYSCISPFDKSCSTYNLDGFQPTMDSKCPKFICYEAFGYIGEMVTCVDAMDCQMLQGMTTYYGDEGKDTKENDTILFLREMIPHHQNAVNMAKNFMATKESNCLDRTPAPRGEKRGPKCLLDPVVRGIINTQNSQIQAMLGLLETFDVAEEAQCEVILEASAHSPAKVSYLGAFVALLAGFELLGF